MEVHQKIGKSQLYIRMKCMKQVFVLYDWNELTSGWHKSIQVSASHVSYIVSLILLYLFFYTKHFNIALWLATTFRIPDDTNVWLLLAYQPELYKNNKLYKTFIHLTFYICVFIYNWYSRILVDQVVFVNWLYYTKLDIWHQKQHAYKLFEFKSGGIAKCLCLRI